MRHLLKASSPLLPPECPRLLFPEMPTPSSSSSAPSATPSGCDAGDFRPGFSGTTSGGFSGCVVNNASIRQECCTNLGSTAAFVNETCGCPYNGSTGFTSSAPFFACVNEASDDAVAGCSGQGTTSAAGRRQRWNAAVVVLVAALVAGAVGV
ncbi:hypothetical protein B0H17DRAFT_1088111 [Mycena rosella]|uniref:Uncharacterized protein n=1 Tax=Mycena rosella TaxID=1033263 RepID=A0AAD7CWY3_MYCRO|nr:hypothetical protein B0H17DRAFT_1088111 [Mycena rosella]